MVTHWHNTLTHIFADFLGFATCVGVPRHRGEYELFLAHIGLGQDRPPLSRYHQIFLRGWDASKSSAILTCCAVRVSCDFVALLYHMPCTVGCWDPVKFRPYRVITISCSLLYFPLLFYSLDIHDSLKSTGYEAPSADNVVVEIFDILACNDERYSALPSFSSSFYTT